MFVVNFGKNKIILNKPEIIVNDKHVPCLGDFPHTRYLP